jgi:Pyruvate/2-oxoacid:ferredoxin oxidoreductase delta subunit
MANEKRLIDANALKEKLKGHHDFFVDGCGGFRYLTPKDKARVDEIDNCIAEIVNAPTVDAVEVVRCKDCKYFCPYEGEEHKGDCAELVGLESCVYEDDFCSYGGRRTDDG